MIYQFFNFFLEEYFFYNQILVKVAGDILFLFFIVIVGIGVINIWVYGSCLINMYWQID